MSYEYDTRTVGDLTVKVVADDNDYDHDSPREWCNLGTMVCWHRRVDLGDETIDTGQYESLAEMVEAHAGENPIYVNLWLYEHSGMTMTATLPTVGNPYSCRWDSGQVGFAYVSVEKLIEEYGSDTPEHRATALEVLMAEVETYDAYLRGDIAGFVIEDEDGDVLESCWDFYPSKSSKDDIFGFNYVMEEAVSLAEHIYAKKIATKGEQLAFVVASAVG